MQEIPFEHKKNLFYCADHQTLQQAVDSLSLQTLKMQLDTVLSKYSLAVPAMSRDV